VAAVIDRETRRAAVGGKALLDRLRTSHQIVGPARIGMPWIPESKFSVMPLSN
jgi:hypothetical protein